MSNMEGVIIGLIVAAVQTVITTIVGLIIKAKWDKEKKNRSELERLREEKRCAEENSRCNLVKETIHEEIETLSKEVKQEFTIVKEDTELMKKAMQKDIRRSLRQDGAALVERGWATQQEKTEFDELYWSYHNLGRNGVVDALHDEVMHLPLKKPTARRSSKKILVEDK